MFSGAPSLTAAGGVDFTSYGPLLVPIATIITGWLAFLGIKRGKRVEESQQNAKNRLDERVQSLNELAKINERLEAENARLRASRDDEATRRRDEIERRDAVHRAAEKRCRHTTEQLLHELDTLRSVVTGEIAKAAAMGAAVDAAHHIERHDQATPDGNP